MLPGSALLDLLCPSCFQDSPPRAGRSRLAASHRPRREHGEGQAAQGMPSTVPAQSAKGAALPPLTFGADLPPGAAAPEVSCRLHLAVLEQLLLPRRKPSCPCQRLSATAGAGGTEPATALTAA